MELGGGGEGTTQIFLAQGGETVYCFVGSMANADNVCHEGKVTTSVVRRVSRRRNRLREAVHRHASKGDQTRRATKASSNEQGANSLHMCLLACLRPSFSRCSFHPVRSWPAHPLLSRLAVSSSWQPELDRLCSLDPGVCSSWSFCLLVTLRPSTPSHAAFCPSKTGSSHFQIGSREAT
jgi:hypothetical protein